ncbi:hypothetical protein AVDCRST_MAG84-5151 [uncultured Microcoleus sp.]|uniref:Uncharacterized protein n=1 Tax=uncultured Microcoleus sp. TaxID=259945 RepID=A0A6J4NAL2_9CYAN|nr:hypothetical protein AVDCRST_MAG84-5151 [uncultured Microcoleus sp.]
MCLMSRTSTVTFPSCGVVILILAFWQATILRKNVLTADERG